MVEKILVSHEIQIGSHTYTIYFDPALADEGDYGKVNHRTQEIHLNPFRPPSQKAGALVHEILHIINHVYCGGKADGELIDGFSEGLAQALQGLGVEFDWSRIEEKHEV